MIIKKNVRLICFALGFYLLQFPVAAEDFTNAIHSYLKHCIETDKINCGIVVGIVDEHGSCIVSYGKMDDSTDMEVNGDTLFEIGSVTKTFTTLLLQDMIERGEMKLDDPVAKYLPKSIKMPIYGGKEITLLHLATHTSGLPHDPDNYDSKRSDNPYADYSIEKLYAFLSGYKMTRPPGAQWEYSNPGMDLLGHVIALKAGTNYESLLEERICQPLKMDSTRIWLTPVQKTRFATGHNELGYAVSHYDSILPGAGAIRSTARDLLKYVSSNLGLTPSSLTPLMEKTHSVYFRRSKEYDMGLAWWISSDPQGTKIISHGGATGGFRAYIGFDKALRRGVVVLSNSALAAQNLGKILLKSEWQSNRRPAESRMDSQVYNLLVGQYQRSKNQPCIGIRREGNCIYAETTGPELPTHAELLPESENRHFERLTGMPMTFSRNKSGGVTGFSLVSLGQKYVYIKISNQPPKAPEPIKTRSFIKLDSKQLDDFIGQYKFVPDALSPAGLKMSIWREGDQLLAKAWGKNGTYGAMEIYPESETNFFAKDNGAQLTFIRNDKGAITDVVIHSPLLDFEGHFGGRPDQAGKKLK